MSDNRSPSTMARARGHHRDHRRYRAAAVAAVLALATVLSPAAPPARAGSTGTTGLYTPQGGAAGTANGDFIASSSPGLDTFYRYFVEVPPGLTRLVVEIFDADVGDGGDPETNAGRDRDRGSWNTTATYSLINPSGSAVTTLFTTGDVDEPAGADNAWLALYDATGDDFLDTFSSTSYSNDNGTFDWETSWIESNDNGNPNNGVIQINGGELRMRDNGGASSAIEREADLVAAGFTGATFSFDARTQNVEGGDRFRVEVSGDGGGSWFTLLDDTGAVNDSFSYDITSYIADDTRIRFTLVSGYTGTDTLWIDDVRISGPVPAGHWEVRVNQTTGTAINAIGLRAHDGTSGSGGTELNVYYDSHNQYGVNPPGSGTASRSYTFYPYITSGCSASKNDFDYDSNRGTVGSMTFDSRTGSFTQSYASSSLSTDNNWRQDTFSGWTSDTDAVDYGIWSAGVSITSYLVSGTPNGNYANLWFGSFQAGSATPAANPTANAFRVYLPTDAGAAPAKPYVEQLLRYAEVGPNPPAAGQTTRYAVTVRVVNPGAQAITFSTPDNVVTANVPGGGTVYAGSAAVGQGTIVSQPSVGGTGNVVWNPGTLAAGATAILTYRVDVTPGSVGQRVLATATPASGDGTRAQFLDHTGNTSQARATYLAGPICELGITEGLATQAVISAFTAHDEGGAVVVEWQTASEAGTVGFDLYRRSEPDGEEWVQVNGELLLGLLHAPQGGTYRFVDEGISPRDRPAYMLAETEATGGRRFYGPFSPWIEVGTEAGRGGRPESGFERIPHAAHPAPAAQKAADAVSFAAEEAGARQAMRLTVREPGLYYVRSADVASLLGVTLQKAEKMVGAGELSLTRLGQPVPWIAAPGEGPAGREAKRADGLYFYGEPADSLYAQGTVYKLARGNALWMKVARVEPSSPASLSSPVADSAAAFLDTLRREEDRLPATVISPDPESDYWFWEFLQSGDPTFGTKTFSIDAPGLKPGSSPDREGSLTVSLQGATATGVAGEHHVEVRLNGTVLGEDRWEGIAGHVASFPVPPGLLEETANQVEIAGLLDSEVPFSVLYVDALELSYPRSYHTRGDALRFGADGHADLSVTGFSAASVVLLDVTDPARPLWVEGAARENDGNGQGAGPVRIRFRPAARHSRYLAAGPAGVHAPEMAPWQNAGLRSRQSADYLVLTTAELAPAAERLANLRRAQGLEARVVDMAAVADEFGFGVASPHAIRSFLAFTQSDWRKAPRYVVLAGAGTLDYRDLLGFGGNLLPPLFAQSTGGLFAADNRLADTSGDGLPEMAIGRIPVTTAAELDAYVDKLAAYESGAGGAGGDDWIGRALFLSDAPDRGANFAAASERIEALLPAGYTARRIDLTATPLDQARNELFQALGEGVSLVNYLGHGGLDRLSGAGLLANTDVPALANAGRLPVVTAMTCTVNRFGVPGVPSLGELLVDSPGGGAVAVWSASGLSVNAEAGQLAARFYRLLDEPGSERLGDLILRSLSEFAGLGGDNSLLDLYNLLGDPALQLRRAASPPPIPSSSSGE